METDPSIDDQTGRVVGFLIENVYVSVKQVAAILSAVPGVEKVVRRRPFGSFTDYVHIRFEFHGEDYVVEEPHGDNSDYWIGPRERGAERGIVEIEEAFKRYQPRPCRQFVGDLVTLRFLKRRP